MTIIWEWGFDYDLLVKNCNKYVLRHWNESVKECAITLDGIEQDEGINYLITGYTKNKSKVPEIASKLLSAALLGSKIRDCNVELSKVEFPKKGDSLCREEELKMKADLLYERVGKRLIEKDDTLRVKIKDTGKVLIVDWNLRVTSYVDSVEATYVVDCYNSLLGAILPFAKKIAYNLGNVVGFSLFDKVEDPIAIDVEEDGKNLYVTAIERSCLIK